MSPTIIALALACSSGPKVGECTYNGDCGDGQACLDLKCEDVACTESTDCGIQQFCSPRFECVDGCETSADCMSGEFCGQESHKCYAASCRDTQLDCAYGEFCDETTGECYPSPDDVCTDCNPANTSSCGAQNTCYPTEPGGSCDAGNGDRDCAAGQGCFVAEMGDVCNVIVGDRDCPTGWYCDTFDDQDGDGWPDSLCHRDSCYSGSCLSGCRTQSDCPRGFQCSEIWLGDPAKYCFADCSFLEDGGYLR